MRGATMEFLDIVRPSRVINMNIFGVPLPFKGVTSIRQQNAIWSWNEMEFAGWIYLLGLELDKDDLELLPMNVIQVNPIETDEFGTPLISNIFSVMQALADDRPVVYINSDVIIAGIDGAVQICEEQFEDFLIVGRRYDLNITDYLDFDIAWEMDLLMQCEWDGDLHPCGAIDWFAFTPGLYTSIPPFAIGRSAWDNWLVIDALRQGVPVIDASKVTMTIHQNKRTFLRRSISEEREEQRRRNRAYYNQARDQHAGSSRDATWVLTPEGLHKQ